MTSSIVKRSVVIAGHETSVSLEDAFWASVREIAKDRGQTLSQLIGSIDSDRQYGGNGNLSSAIRPFVLGFYLNQPGRRAGTPERFAA
jgi:predicted DNA-binding ribbon-helix-helix protein